MSTHQRRALGNDNKNSSKSTELFTSADVDGSLLSHPFWSDDGLPYDFGTADEHDEHSGDTLEFVPPNERSFLKKETRR